MARILGIESSCDETAAAVVEDSRLVLSNIVASQADLHAQYGGVFPEMASRQHIHDIAAVVREAMRIAAVDWDALDGIAVTRGPGLAGSLLVGLNSAKGLAMARDLPLIGINHMEGHLYSNWLHVNGKLRTPALISGNADSKESDLVAYSAELDRPPPFPHLLLTISGGHTDLVHVRGHGDYERLGQTLDDAAGEAFDKAARMLGLGYPGGPEIQSRAEDGRPGEIQLPIADTEGRFDFSFSGLKTAVLRQVQSREGDLSDQAIADIALGFQMAVIQALTSRVKRALKAREAKALLLAGGVSANGPLRQAMRELLQTTKRDIPLISPPIALCTDNAAMIAAAGHWAFVAGRHSELDLDVAPGLKMGEF